MRLTGLADIKKAKDEELARRARAEKGVKKNNWMKLKDGKTVLAQFLQELDTTAKHYSEKNGLGFMAVEHTAPHNFKLKALCTADDGACVGCEQNQLGWAGKEETGYKGEWKAKRKLYVNALLRHDDGTEEVVIVSQSDGPKSIGGAIIEYAVEDNYITHRWFKITRQGLENATVHTMFAKKEDPKEEFDPESYELNDLDFAVRNIPYAEQAAFYQLVDRGDEDKPAAKREEPASLENVDW
jgi:hypothetical protein